MKSTDIPSKFPIPFGNNASTGTIRPIPQGSQASITPGAASLYDGFPSVTGQPIASGGIPPALQDFNGILNQVTAWARWQAVAGLVPFDPSFSSAVGGYPQGAAVVSTATPGRIWICTADNNTSNPDTGGANWISIVIPSDIPAAIVASPYAGTRGATPILTSQTWSVPANVYYLKRVTLWGAGGSGGGSAGSGGAGSGGGGGGYSQKFNIPVTPGQQIPITVGVGGGTSGPGNGGPGSTTSFASIFYASGGGAGTLGNGSPQNSANGQPGSGNGGDVNATGSGGSYGYSIGGTAAGGIGGSSPFGGSIPNLNLVSPGNNGNFPGGGSNGGSAGNASGVAANGFCLIEY